MTNTNKPIIPNDVAELQQLIKTLSERLEKVENRPNLDKDVFNTEEAAAFLGVTRSQLYKLTHAQATPFYKPTGKLVLFDRKEVIEWGHRGRVMSVPEIQSAVESKMRDLATL